MWSFEQNYKDYAGLATEPSLVSSFTNGVCGQVFFLSNIYFFLSFYCCYLLSYGSGSQYFQFGSTNNNG